MVRTMFRSHKEPISFDAALQGHPALWYVSRHRTSPLSRLTSLPQILEHLLHCGIGTVVAVAGIGSNTATALFQHLLYPQPRP